MINLDRKQQKSARVVYFSSAPWNVLFAVATPSLSSKISNRSSCFHSKQKPTFKSRITPGFALFFLECSGETVKGVLKVSAFVSTGAVVLLYQVHSAVTAFSLFTANSLPLLHLSLSVIVLCLSPPSLSLPVSVVFSQFLLLGPLSPPSPSSLFLLRLIGPICTHLINQMVRFFCCSLPAHPPFPFHLSLVCIQCFPHRRPVLWATPTPSRTPTHSQTHTHAHSRRPQCSAYQSCSSFCLALKNVHTSWFTTRASHTPKTLNKRMLYGLQDFLLHTKLSMTSTLWSLKPVFWPCFHFTTSHWCTSLFCFQISQKPNHHSKLISLRHYMLIGKTWPHRVFASVRTSVLPVFIASGRFLLKAKGKGSSDHKTQGWEPKHAWLNHLKQR